MDFPIDLLTDKHEQLVFDPDRPSRGSNWRSSTEAGTIGSMYRGPTMRGSNASFESTIAAICST
jgi:hypothetical protein